MIDTALRSLAQRRLRSVLTLVAVVLGVAMVSGTYVQTDRISTAFDEIAETSYAGVDVVVAPHEDFSGSFAQVAPTSERLVERAARVPGVDRAEGQLYESGSLVVGGRMVKPTFAPMIVSSLTHAPFDVLRVVEGRQPSTSGEVVIDARTAAEEHVHLGQRAGVATRTGVQPVRVVGIVRFGDVSSVGGATFVGASLADVQRWFDHEGRVSEIFVAARPGVAPAVLARRVGRAMPASVDVTTADQTVVKTQDEIADAMGFLRPALLAFAGAALLVGAFIIFNTFTITVAERTREFALLRALGATRGQVLRSVGVEALALGAVASALGLAVGLGFAWGLGVLFDAAGMGIPAGGAHLALRTILVSVAIGIVVTLLAALVPAVRATRVAPVLALQAQASAPPSRHPRLRALAAVLAALVGLALVGAGMLGAGPAVGRLATMGIGVLLVFVGVAASARYVIRPLAAVTGWPLRRLGGAMGEIAEENAARNPGRTAATAGALMVGLGLVVFVAVFAAGLTSSLRGSFDDRVAADYIVSSDTGVQPVPAQAGEALAAAAPGATITAQYVDQVEVNGAGVDTLTDVLNGLDPATLLAFYRFDWRRGSDAAVARLDGTNALVEEQFAKQHGIVVGDRFRLTGPSGASRTATAIAEYRDPQLLQGVIVAPSVFRRLSAQRDPFALWVAASASASTEARLSAALAAFPALKVRTVDEYRDLILGRVDQIVTMLYALLALSLVISLFGIANSLFLSIHERTRELGMLRAIGATGGQVRQLIRFESMITAVIGGLLGTVIGVVFAWLTTTALDDLGLSFRVPGAELVILLALAVVVGIVGAVMPARRAARMNVLQAVATGE